MKLSLEISVKRVGESVEPLIRNLNELGNAAESATNRGAAGTVSLTKALRDAYIQVQALREVFEVVKKTVERGFEFNAELQKSQLLLGAMLYKNQAIYDAQGKQLTGQAALNTALGIAAGLQEKLLQASLRYGLEYQGIASTAQLLLATTHGQVKDLESIVELSVKLNKATTVMGMNPFMVMRDVRAMMTGNVSELSMLLGISGNDLLKMRASGDMIGELNKRLEVFIKTSQLYRATLPGAWGALKNALDQALGKGTQDQMGAVTQLINKLADAMVTVDQSGKTTFNPQFVGAVSKVAAVFVEIAQAAFRIADALGKVKWFFDKFTMLPQVLSFMNGSFLLNPPSPAQRPDLTVSPQYQLSRLLMLLGPQGSANFKQQFSQSEALKQAVAYFKTHDYSGAPIAPGGAPHIGPGPNVPDENQQRSLELSKQRIAVMETEADIAQTQAKLAADKLGLLTSQLGVEKAIREVMGLTSEDQQKTITHLQTIFQLADQFLTTQATAAKKFDENQKEFDKAKAAATHDKYLTSDQRAIEIGAARDVQKQKDEATQAELNLGLAQVRAKIADNEVKITQDFLDEVAKRNRALLAGTVEAIKAQLDYDNRYVKAQKAMYDDIAQYGTQSVQQGLVDVFSGSGLRGAAHSFVDDFHRSLAAMLTTDVETFLKRLAATASGQKRYNPATGRYEIPSPAEQRNARYEQMGLQSAVALYGLYSSGQAGASRTQNTISGGIQGAAIGAQVSVVGAVIGAVIGAIAGALTTKDKPWYTVTVSGGHVSITGQNAHSADLSQATAAINQAITQGQASIDAVFAAFPTAIAQGLHQRSLTDIITGGSRKFNDATLKQFVGVDIPKMFLESYASVIGEGMSSLGVSQSRIQQIMAEAKAKDPNQAFQFIADYVSAFVKLQDYVSFMKKSVADKSKIATTELNKSPADQLADYNVKILALVDGFDQLTNDQQIARVRQINDLTTQRYELELQYLNDIKNAQSTIHRSIAEQVFGMQVQGSSRGEATGLIQQRRSTILGQLGEAKTPQEVAQLAQEYQQLTSQLYQFAVSVRDEFQSLLDGFKALADLPGKDAEAGKSPVERVKDLTIRINQLADGFDQLSSEDQVARGREILDLANQRYEIEKAAMQQIIDLTKSITDSVEKQIFEIQQQGRNPQQQTDALLERQRALFDRIRNATTADEVNAAMGELQSNANTLLQLLGPGGAQQVIDMLTSARDLTLQKLHDFGTMLQGQMDSTQQAIQNVTNTLQTSFTSASDAVNQLRIDLINFGDHAIAALQGFADALGPIDDQLAGPLQQVLNQFGGDLDQADINLGRFGDGLDDATNRLHKFADALGGGNARPIVNIHLSGSAEAWTQSVAVEAAYIVGNQQAQAARVASRLTRSGGL